MFQVFLYMFGFETRRKEELKVEQQTKNIEKKTKSEENNHS